MTKLCTKDTVDEQNNVLYERNRGVLVVSYSNLEKLLGLKEGSIRRIEDSRFSIEEILVTHDDKDNGARHLIEGNIPSNLVYDLKL